VTLNTKLADASIPLDDDLPDSDADPYDLPHLLWSESEDDTDSDVEDDTERPSSTNSRMTSQERMLTVEYFHSSTAVFSGARIASRHAYNRCDGRPYNRCDWSTTVASLSSQGLQDQHRHQLLQLQPQPQPQTELVPGPPPQSHPQLEQPQLLPLPHPQTEPGL
jgi:hypothetical protein